jgi:glc operon protein GlcG
MSLKTRKVEQQAPGFRRRRDRWTVGLVILAAVAMPSGAHGQETEPSSRPTLSLAGARAVADAAVAEARRLNAPGAAIAEVDDGGHLIFLVRLDDTFPAASRVAEGKARTAAVFRRPTKELEDAIVGGRSALLNVADAPLQGGVPLIVDGHVVGAVGVSGAASAAQDTELAIAGAAALRR